MASLVHVWAESPSGHHRPFFLFGLALCIQRSRCTSNPQFLNPTPSGVRGVPLGVWTIWSCIPEQLSFYVLFWFGGKLGEGRWLIIVLFPFELMEHGSRKGGSPTRYAGDPRRDKLRRPLFFIEVQLIYNVVLVSGVQQGDSLIRIYPFSDSFPL